MINFTCISDVNEYTTHNTLVQNYRAKQLQLNQPQHRRSQHNAGPDLSIQSQRGGTAAITTGGRWAVLRSPSSQCGLGSNVRSCAALVRAARTPTSQPPPQPQQAARSRISDLQQELAAAKAEAMHWRQQYDQRQRDAAAADGGDQEPGAAAGGGGGSLGKMQERLARVKKEQADADAMRESAWADLKAVVSDITSLASVDNLQSVSGCGLCVRGVGVGVGSGVQCRCPLALNRAAADPSFQITTPFETMATGQHS